MAQISGTSGKILLNGKEIGIGEWSMDTKPPEPDYAPIPIPEWIRQGYTIEFTGTFTYWLPCRITVNLPLAGEYTLTGMCNQERSRVYLESPIENGYLLYHLAMDIKRLTLERREHDLKVARAWVLDTQDE